MTGRKLALSGMPADPVRLRSPALCRFFAGVMARQMRRSFRAVRLARPGAPELPAGRPVIVYSNHPSWWDPVFYIVLAPRLFPDRESYGPMEERALERYGFMKRIGIFGVATESRAGAARFLATSRTILEDPRRMLWVAAQGRFSDPRERPVRLRPGVAHLMARLPGALALPLAFEYPFWSERRPEALAAFGPPLDAGEGGDAQAWTGRLERALETTADRLASWALARDPAAFELLLGGRAGVGGVWGGWSRLRAAARGERYLLDHMADRP